MIEPKVFVLDDPAAVAREAARQIVFAARVADDHARSFTLVLAGGSTPKAVYRILAEGTSGLLHWPSTHILFGDERCVPPDHADSNYRMAHESLLSKVPIHEQCVHRIEGERGPDAGAHAYDRTLRSVLETAPDHLLDVVLLGMGADGHTASLFPGRGFAGDGELLAVPAIAPPASPIKDRITLTPKAIACSRHVIYLVTGAEKRDMLARVLDAAKHGGDPSLPASMVTSAGQVVWLVDRAAHPD